MFWNKKSDAKPLGVPLGDLQLMLNPTSIEASLKDNALIARHEHYTTRIEVVPPETKNSENGTIRAVVRILTELPKPIQSLFQGRGPNPSRRITPSLPWAPCTESAVTSLSVRG